MDGFHRFVHVADDGEHLAIEYRDLLWADPDRLVISPEVDALNARDTISAWSPMSYSPDAVMVRFIERGRLMREVTVRELLPDQSKLQQTASSWHWGHFGEINERG